MTSRTGDQGFARPTDKRTDLKAKAREVESSVDVRAFIANRYATVFDVNGKGTCPCRENHRNGDATPSFTVDTQGRCRCWSQSCFGDKPADLFKVIMVKEKVGFAEAVRIVEGGSSPAQTDLPPHMYPHPELGCGC